MRRDSLYHAIPVHNVFAECSASGPRCGKEGVASSTRRLSLTCPHCRTSILDIPEDILEIDEESNPQPSQAKRWNKRPHWISRPLRRKGSDASTLYGGTSTGSAFRLDIEKPPRRQRRRGSISSEVSDSSSQTKVEQTLPRSILQHSPSMSSGKGSTLTAKRSVKFSDEPVYYDYSYRHSHVCEHADMHTPHCKFPYDCSGDCLFEELNYGYDIDMFSFEQPDKIPSERRWGFFSRLVAWLRRKTGGRKYTIQEEKRRPVISRPQPLAPRACLPVKVVPNKDKRNNKVKTKRLGSLRSVCG